MAKTRILVLEDDRDIIELVCSALDPNYECYAAGNGMEGIKLAMLGEPELIICDIMMPVMDGWEFVRRLRKFSGFEKTPVIFLTALANKENIQEGYKLGVGLYLTKPIDPVRLRRNIELFIDDHAIQPRNKKIGIEDLLLADQSRLDELLKVAQQPAVAASHDRFGSTASTKPQPPRPAPVAAPPSPNSPQSGQSANTQAQARNSYQPLPLPMGLPQPQPQAAASGDTLKKKNPFATSSQARSFMARAAEMVASTKEGPSKPRIMVVEDDHDTMLMMVQGLREDFEIVEANDGIAAIERAVKFKPDMFIIDGMLPKMTGYQLTVMLRKNRDFYRSPIIFTSGKGTTKDQQYALKLGINQFIPKPFKMDDLKVVLKQLTSQKDFKPRTDRPSLGGVSIENIHLKEPVQPEPLPKPEQVESRHIENALKRQLKDDTEDKHMRR